MQARWLDLLSRKARLTRRMRRLLCTVYTVQVYTLALSVSSPAVGTATTATAAAIGHQEGVLATTAAMGNG